MKKFIVLLMLAFLLIPSLAISVGYQVSFSGTFCDLDNFRTVYNYLSQIETIGTPARFSDQGDYLHPELSDPNQSSSYRIDMLYRFGKPSSQTALYDYLRDNAAYIDQNQPGYIERHNCYGDERKPCTEIDRESWGGGE